MMMMMMMINIDDDNNGGDVCITYLVINAKDPVVATREPDGEKHCENQLRESRRPRDENDTARPTTQLGVVITLQIPCP